MPHKWKKQNGKVSICINCEATRLSMAGPFFTSDGEKHTHAPVCKPVFSIAGARLTDRQLKHLTRLIIASRLHFEEAPEYWKDWLSKHETDKILYEIRVYVLRMCGSIGDVALWNLGEQIQLVKNKKA